MPKQVASKDLSKITWLPLQFRLTAFLSQSYVINDEQSWWSDITGEKSTRVQRPPGTGSTIEDGLYENNILTLIINTQPPRLIDWRYSVNALSLTSRTDLPSLGELNKAAHQFEKFMKKWLKKNSDLSLTRIAFGSDLVHAVESTEKGLAQILNYVPVETNTENASDFLYQINRMIEISEPMALKINKLSKWSVAAINSTALQTDSVQEPLAINVCRLELDINTNPEPDPKKIFKGTVISKVFSKLITLGEEIAEEGAL